MCCPRMLQYSTCVATLHPLSPLPLSPDVYLSSPSSPVNLDSCCCNYGGGNKSELHPGMKKNQNVWTHLDRGRRGEKCAAVKTILVRQYLSAKGVPLLYEIA